MKLKLGKTNMFLIILASLILSSSLGWFMREGFDDKDDDTNTTDSSSTANVNPVTIEQDISPTMEDSPSQGGIINDLGMNDTSRLGVTKSSIPQGQEDLYILKSQIVPPVCPACPSVTTCPSEKKCTPCPPCARCPEPSFDCKKVPNYSSADNNSVPRAVLNDFSAFGM